VSAEPVQPSDELIDACAALVYDEPWEVCEKCDGIGRDENAHFWCSDCKAQGWIVDEAEVPLAWAAAREIAGEIIGSALAHRGESDRKELWMWEEVEPLVEALTAITELHVPDLAKHVARAALARFRTPAEARDE